MSSMRSAICPLLALTVLASAQSACESIYRAAGVAVVVGIGIASQGTVLSRDRSPSSLSIRARGLRIFSFHC
jgi:hypothetical protein